jgi:predicted nucleotide-binding protein (sugar kinase/HSP70/actin superfamily)
VYAARLYDLPAVGDVFVLQGGTQRNLAAVRAQVQFIRGAFRDSGREPAVHLHPHPAVAGAIGCALLAARRRAESDESRWIGFEELEKLNYATEQSERTRCRGCGNRCARTILHVQSARPSVESVFTADREESIIIAPCERGRASDVQHQRQVRIQEKKREISTPNYALLFESTAFSPPRIAEVMRSMLGREECALEGTESAAQHSICIPRVLNFYSYAPMFIAWFLAMGFREEDIHVSPRTTRAMSSAGTGRATIDPCFPAKICFAHVEALLQTAQRSGKASWLFFPSILRLPSEIADQEDSMTCTVAAVIPEVVNAAYTLELDEFRRHGAEYLHPFLSLATLDAFSTTMAECFMPLLHAPRKTFRRAAEIAWAMQERIMRTMQDQARRTLETLEQEKRLGIVLLGRPYHADRGLNHGVLDALQEMGFPLFTAETLPKDSALLARLFDGENARAVRDVWPNPFSENSSRKMWAAKYTARHPNLLPVELSNFKCGHDAPTYSIVREIFQSAGKPLFSFLDLDENTPRNTLNIRLETIRHFLEEWCRAHGYVSPRAIKEDIACLQAV